ncbi:MAG: hypothetical protein ACRYF2_23740 [Janthinobacterium lividum]
MSSSNVIVAFVGQNENGILRHLSRNLMDMLKPFGVEGHVIDLNEPTWHDRFDSLWKQGITMAWGHAGIGAKFEIEGKCFWDQAKIPFISILADPPAWRPCNHNVTSGYVVNAYLYPEWLQVQRRFIKARQPSALVHGGLVPNPHRDDISWTERPRRMIFVKTGADPEQRRAAWSLMPPRWRTVMEDAAAAALARPTGDITDLVVDAAEAHDLVPEQRTELLFSLMTEVDLYVRDTRSTAMTRALLDLPVDIYGRGWDHVSAEATRARFHPAFDADGLPRMYAETQFMLNTSPNFSSGVHERVAYAMDARCCVVSDENDFMKREFEAIPTFFAVDPRDPDLRDRLHEIYHDRTDYTPLTQPALDLTERMFSGERYMLSLLELAHEVRMTAKLVEYRA